MAQVTVQVEQALGDWKPGEVHTVERTKLVDGLIAGNRVTIVAAESAEQGSEIEPPRSGKGSGRDAWARFLDGHGVEYPAGADRDALLALWDTHIESLAAEANYLAKD